MSYSVIVTPRSRSPATRTELVCRSRQLRLRAAAAAALPGVIDIGYAEERRRFNENSAPPRKSEMSVAAAPPRCFVFVLRGTLRGNKIRRSLVPSLASLLLRLPLSSAMIDDLFCYQRPFVVAAVAALWERRVEWKEDRAVQLDAI